ncbi:MAG: ribosome biogenesis GTP-binding protein YsxC [Bdellovibrio sp.]|nr:MAG: ribosome biogenesis GTP-binding protein YsxC [Bdellovibrio sp.]
MFPIQFLRSAASPMDYPPANLPEIALAGRSNAGKSSFLNQLSGGGRKPVAKVSQAPGKTRLLNFFEVPAKYRWVDMPGYGFAGCSGHEVRSWKNLVETYLSGREVLAGSLLLMDGRREWTADEENLRAFFHSINLPFAIVMTKADKMTGSAKREAQERILRQSGAPVFLISNLVGKSADEVEEFCFRSWIQPFFQVGASGTSTDQVGGFGASADQVGASGISADPLLTVKIKDNQ